MARLRRGRDRQTAKGKPGGGPPPQAREGKADPNGRWQDGDPLARVPDARRDGPPPLMREIRLNRGGQWFTYQAVAQQTADGGVLLVLRDVTALAATVQMKTDFVANASHELRTPIAAIKIAFETLRYVYQEDAAQSDRCMQIIDGHLHRLEEMLRDLLDMAKVESPTLRPHIRRIKTNEVLSGVRSALGTMARQKLVELRLDDGGDGCGRGRSVESFLTDLWLL